MAATRVDDIVAAVITELSQVPGVATQVYAADRIRQFVQDAFLMEFDDFPWPQYLDYVTTQGDGTTGRLANDLVGAIGPISDYSDIRSVFRTETSKKVMALPQSVNPFVMTGSSALYMSPDGAIPNRPFRVWPQTSVEQLVVQGMQRPRLPFGSDDTVLIDPLLLQYDASWMYCVDDGTVPAQVNKFQVLAQKRRQIVISALNNQPIPLDPRIPILDPTSPDILTLNKTVLG
jgi:hypothetical protein